MRLFGDVHEGLGGEWEARLRIEEEPLSVASPSTISPRFTTDSMNF